MKAIRLVAILSLALTMGLIGMDTAHASPIAHANGGEAQASIHVELR